MDKLYFKVSSITNAQRGQQLLRNQGIPAKIQRLQRSGQGDGCGYTIVVAVELEKLAEKVLTESGIRIIGVENG